MIGLLDPLIDSILMCVNLCEFLLCLCVG